MLDPSAISLKEYLRLSKRRQKNPLIIPEYDDFILKIWTFFDLRATAEDNFRKHKYLAKNNRGALPLNWRQIADRLEDSGPPVNVVSQIAKLRYGDVDHIIRNLRKVLNRVRQKESLSRVQQIDSHCLRWLVRQPGRSAIEKAGSRQEILAIIRVENFDTLENRVLKDFLLRASSASAFYLRKYAFRYPDHALIRAVTKFNNLCAMGLSLPVMENIRPLYDMPQPNYVLQQDMRYSKVWCDYCKLIRQEEIAEKLWDKRKECLDDYSKSLNGLALHCSPFAKYHAPIWFNELDGKRDILDKPWWANERAGTQVVDPQPPRNKVTIVDLTSPWDGRRELVYGYHDNSKPFIQNQHRPNVEPQKDVIAVQEIVRRGRSNGEDKLLRDYFEQLYGLLGGDQWVVMVPDTWEAQWLEQVKRCCPLPRSKVFLIWRSIAAALGCVDLWQSYDEGDSLVVVDGDSEPNIIATKLLFKRDKKSRRVLPQRASYRLHSEDRYSIGVFGACAEQVSNFSNASKDVVCTGYLTHSNFSMNRDVRYASSEDLIRGVERFLEERNKGLVSYFDELDAFTLIRTNRNEEIEKAILIEHEECWPGGYPYRTKKPIYAGTLSAGESKMSLFMFEGVPDVGSKLKLFEQEFDSKTIEAAEISMDAELTPGQGLATITVRAGFLENDVELALHDKTKLLDSEMTILRIERELKRHFPPNMPYVEACAEIWNQILPDLRSYGRTGILKDNGLFAKAQGYWGVVNPNARPTSGVRRYGIARQFDKNSMSPIDRLKRENVFGNNPLNRLPSCNFDFDKLFAWLAMKYRRNVKVLRLIAWTYQYDNPVFEPIREELYDRYTVQGCSLDAVSTSFCSNTFATGDNRIVMILNTALQHISFGVQTQDELRLVYNLLQFHPESVQGCESDLCEHAFDKLVSGYNKYTFFSNEVGLFGTREGRTWNGKIATQMAGYFLKCMLFLLHRRRFDPCFLKSPKGWKLIKDKTHGDHYVPPGFLAEELPVRQYASKTLEGHEVMRRSFIEYVNGRGTLEGIPNE